MFAEPRNTPRPPAGEPGLDGGRPPSCGIRGRGGCGGRFWQMGPGHSRLPSPAGGPPAAPACPPRRRQTAPQSPPDTRQLPDSDGSATRCGITAWPPLPGQDTEAERGAAMPPGRMAGRRRSSWATRDPAPPPTCCPLGAGPAANSQLPHSTRGPHFEDTWGVREAGGVQSSPPPRCGGARGTGSCCCPGSCPVDPSWL